MSLLRNVDPQELFGNEAGEEESPDFLKEVYIESGIYKRALGTDRVLCVRSRKGVGKSALLARAHQEIEENNIPTLWLSPTDLAIDVSNLEYNVIVDRLKKRMARLCVGKLAEKVGFSASGETEEALLWAEKDGFRSKDFVRRVAKTFQGVAKAKADDTASEEAVSRLLSRLSEGKNLVVFVDDFDRGWSPTGIGSIRIKALVSAIREIVRECESIDFRIALREDVWQFLELTDEQIDKFRQYAHFLKWDDQTLLKILTKRIWLHAIKNDPNCEESCTSDINIFNLLFDRSYKWIDETKQMHEVLTKLSRRRPRDILQLAKGAATRAQDQRHILITEQDVRNEYYKSFSRVRTLDLIKEFKNECSEIESMLSGFGGIRNSWIMPYDDVMKRIKSVNGHIVIRIFEKRAEDIDCLAFLYRCGFISAREDITASQYRHLEYEDAPALLDARVGIEHFDWEIHPAFRPHLETLQASPFHKSVSKERRKKKKRF